MQMGLTFPIILTDRGVVVEEGQQRVDALLMGETCADGLTVVAVGDGGALKNGGGGSGFVEYVAVGGLGPFSQFLANAGREEEAVRFTHGAVWAAYKSFLQVV